VLSHPLLARLKERSPDAVIDVLAPSWALPVYRRMPEVGGAIALPFGHGDLALGARRRFARSLPRYDEAFVLPNSIKSALIPWHAGIPKRTGYRGEMRYGLLNDVRRMARRSHPSIVERFAALADAAGEPLRRPVPEPRLLVDPESRAATVAKFALDTERPVAAFAPGAEYGAAKRWPVAHFTALGRTLTQRGWQVWLFGSPNDREAAAQIASEVPDAINLAGATSLDEAIDLLSLATHVVTNDSGLMHVAAALDRPMTALFGSSSPEYTPPLSRNARVITLKLECSPCFKRECPLGHLHCLVKITPERVLSEMP
jgi:heptosyltransferase-2